MCCQDTTPGKESERRTSVAALWWMSIWEWWYVRKVAMGHPETHLSKCLKASIPEAEYGWLFHGFYWPGTTQYAGWLFYIDSCYSADKVTGWDRITVLWCQTMILPKNVRLHAEICKGFITTMRDRQTYGKSLKKKLPYGRSRPKMRAARCPYGALLYGSKYSASRYLRSPSAMWFLYAWSYQIFGKECLWTL